MGLVYDYIRLIYQKISRHKKQGPGIFKSGLPTSEALIRVRFKGNLASIILCNESTTIQQSQNVMKT